MKKVITRPMVAAVIVLTVAMTSNESLRAQVPTCVARDHTASTIRQEIAEHSGDMDVVMHLVERVAMPGECQFLADGVDPTDVLGDLMFWSTSLTDEQLSRSVMFGIGVIASQQSHAPSARLIPFAPLRLAVDQGATRAVRQGALSVMMHMLDRPEVAGYVASQVRAQAGPSGWPDLPEHVAAMLTSPSRYAQTPAAVSLVESLRSRPTLIASAMARCRIEGRYRTGELRPNQSRCDPG